MKVLGLVLSVLLLSGCASSSDLEALQIRVEGLAVNVDQLHAESVATNAYVLDALASAGKANQQSLEVLAIVKKTNEDVNKKLDALFKQRIVK